MAMKILAAGGPEDSTGETAVRGKAFRMSPGNLGGMGLVGSIGRIFSGWRDETG
jgi:hypothetical protein